MKKITIKKEIKIEEGLSYKDFTSKHKEICDTLQIEWELTSDYVPMAQVQYKTSFGEEFIMDVMLSHEPSSKLYLYLNNLKKDLYTIKDNK